MSQEISTSPQVIGTRLVEATGNQNIHYVLGVVALYEAEGLQPEFDSYDSSSKTIKYSYSYPNGTPTANAKIKNYPLSVFLPQSDASGSNLPKFIEVFNSTDPDEKASGEIQTNKPVKIYYSSPSTQSANIKDASTEPVVDNPRNFVIENTLTQPDGSKTDYSYIFVIVKTDNSNERLLNHSTSGKTLTGIYEPVSDSPSAETIPRAAVLFLPMTTVKYEKVKVLTFEDDVSYTSTDIKLFHVTQASS